MAIIESQEQSIYKPEAIKRRRLNTLNPTTTEPQDWAFESKRFLRRSNLERVRDNNHGIFPPDTRQEVRSHEARIDLDYHLSKLTGIEIFVDPRMDALASDVAQIVISKFGFAINAIVVQGSASYGGDFFRQATQAEREPDFDWAILFQKGGLFNLGLNQLIARLATKTIERAMPKIAAKHGFSPSFHSCESVNPINYHTPSFQDAAQADEFVLSATNNPRKMQLMQLYFLSSYPSQVNEKNQALIMQSLEKLKQINYSAWAITVEKIIKNFKETRRLDEKHLPISKYKRTNRLRSRTINSSSRILNLPLKKILMGEDN